MLANHVNQGLDHERQWCVEINGLEVFEIDLLTGFEVQQDFHGAPSFFPHFRSAS
ncbi:Unknown protein sequence [Pseudomonas amygdali pv. lachrymans]|uniref:Uncharacterized protein n=1 Tax=Pseudomonas amygdali pv. lachrymans TaxID=53707 RepID=A0ABR5KU60_PSEAV|nr:Unknown protein sequence [Pseudomonas amygdali pv. lachrymans]KPC18221.1 Unknown protein sequence [Pseudomonas amygdali pv. lachrymans]